MRGDVLSESRRISGELVHTSADGCGAVRRAFGTGLRGRTDGSPEKRRGLDGTKAREHSVPQSTNKGEWGLSPLDLLNSVPMRPVDLLRNQISLLT